jgi:PAS domain S-box-containing protein
MNNISDTGQESLKSVSKSSIGKERTLRDRYQGLYDQIPYPCFTVTTTGGIVDVNQFACEYLGYPDQELFQKTIFSIFHPEEQQRLHLALTSCVQRLSKYVAGEFRQISGSGEMVWMKLTLDILPQTDGNPFILIFCEDLTECKKLEESCERVQSQLQLVLNSFPGKISYVDAQMRYQLVSERYQQWSLVSSEEVLGKTVEEFMSPQQYQDVKNYIELSLSGEKVSYGFDAVFNDGKRRYLLVDQVPHTDSSQEVLGFFVFSLDITERKQAEEQLEASLREKEVLLREIHHRVKNNLQVISSLLDLQAQRIQEQQTLELFQESQNRIMSMALIHQELYHSENLDKINFSDYIYNLTNHLIYTYTVNSEPVKLQLDIDNVVLDINTAIPCGLIINELVSNALKYAFAAPMQGMIWVEMYSENNWLTLVVRDNGIGFSSSYRLKASKIPGIAVS